MLNLNRLPFLEEDKRHKNPLHSNNFMGKLAYLSCLTLQGIPYVIFWKNAFSCYAACHFLQAFLSVVQRYDIVNLIATSKHMVLSYKMAFYVQNLIVLKSY